MTTSAPRLRLVPSAVAVVFDEAGRVLLTRRADNGRWCLPSGEMEVGESVEEAAVRETREETGLFVVADKPVGVYSRPHPYYAAKGKHVLAFVFLCRVVGGTLGVTNETTEFGWFAPDALPTDIVPTHPQRIDDAVAVRAGGGFCVR
jgi:8-oxo-dGTP pyrophosphatase MutT (NUDIX family)